jgi:hypothetical protein
VYETCNLSPIKLKLHHFVAQSRAADFRVTISTVDITTVDDRFVVATSTQH